MIGRCPICEPESYYGDKNGPWVEGPVCDRCQSELGTYALRVDIYCGQDYYFPLESHLLQCADHEKLFGPMLIDTHYSIVMTNSGCAFERNPAIKLGLK